MSNLFDPAYRIHPINWNEKPSYFRISRAEAAAECLIAVRIKGHPLAAEHASLLQKVCFEQIRRVDKWIIK